MTTFPGSPRLIRGGIVLTDPTSGSILRVITLQYNPDTVTRTLQVQSISGEGGDRLEAMRLKGPPKETIKVEAEVDATDQLEFPDQNPNAVQVGLYPILAALETIIYPPSDLLISNNNLANAGTLEIIPMEAPLTLFIWSKTRILPVRITEFSVTEEAFDTQLNPIRAKISLGMSVLSVTDLPFSHKGGNLYLVYQKEKERLATLNQGGTLSAFGIGGIS